MDAAAESAADVRHLSVTANGLRFHVAECGAGERLALCLHGFPELWLSWRRQLPLLARLGYRVWAPDLRGYGASERPAQRRAYDLDVLLADVAGLIDAAGCRSTLLVAHDWGGILAWFFAQERLRPLERLVVMNCPHPAAAREGAGLRQLARSWYVFFFQLPRLPELALTAGGGRRLVRLFERSASRPGVFSPEDLEAYRAAVLQPGAAKAMIDYYRMVLRGPGARRLRRAPPRPIETPTLLLWGAGDFALGVETTTATGRYVPNLTMRYLPGVSHWVQQDAPEAVNAMLEAWLEGREVPQADELPAPGGAGRPC
jgi:pimeloyl-ACP methyl ester carboxylesterase